MEDHRPTPDVGHCGQVEPFLRITRATERAISEPWRKNFAATQSGGLPGNFKSGPCSLPELRDSLKAAMAIASDLLQRHFQTLVEDNAQWQTLITDSIVWELPYAPAIGHPPRLSGRLEVVRHVTWFLNTVENFRSTWISKP
jgi:hypothetical protein